ncbi:MAG: hypothetical protein IJ422_07250 [Oscillospiraceae bacterium]|nr:hypothetical protein [Oscillospiraceae bacterium]MBQ9148246.1 hypothetical protein [Oscillospiraceae bacterium]
MSQRTDIRTCIFCGYLIRVNPTTGELGLFCPHCLKSLLTGDDSRSSPKPVRSRWKFFDFPVDF